MRFYLLIALDGAYALGAARRLETEGPRNAQFARDGESERLHKSGHIFASKNDQGVDILLVPEPAESTMKVDNACPSRNEVLKIPIPPRFVPEDIYPDNNSDAISVEITLKTCGCIRSCAGTSA